MNGGHSPARSRAGGSCCQGPGAGGFLAPGTPDGTPGGRRRGEAQQEMGGGARSSVPARTRRAGLAATPHLHTLLENRGQGQTLAEERDLRSLLKVADVAEIMNDPFAPRTGGGVSGGSSTGAVPRRPRPHTLKAGDMGGDRVPIGLSQGPTEENAAAAVHRVHKECELGVVHDARLTQELRGGQDARQRGPVMVCHKAQFPSRYAALSPPLSRTACHEMSQRASLAMTPWRPVEREGVPVIPHAQKVTPRP